MGLWTDRVVLRAFDNVLSNNYWENYLKCFVNVLAKGSVKSKCLRSKTYACMDVRLPVLARVLDSLWSRIVALAACVPGTQLPINAFSELTLIVLNYNTKLTLLGWEYATFLEMRDAFLLDTACC